MVMVDLVRDDCGTAPYALVSLIYGVRLNINSGATMMAVMNQGVPGFTGMALMKCGFSGDGS